MGENPEDAGQERVAIGHGQGVVLDPETLAARMVGGEDHQPAIGGGRRAPAPPVRLALGEGGLTDPHVRDGRVQLPRQVDLRVEGGFGRSSHRALLLGSGSRRSTHPARKDCQDCRV